MNYIILAVSIMLLNFSCGLVNEMGLFTTSAADHLENKFTNNKIISLLTGQQQVSITSILFDSLDYMAAAVDLFILFLQMTLLIPLTLASEPFNWPDYIVYGVGFFMLVTYGVGIAEFLRGFATGSN